MEAIEMRFALMRDALARHGNAADAAAIVEEAMRFIETGYVGKTILELKAARWDEIEAADPEAIDRFQERQKARLGRPVYFE